MMDKDSQQDGFGLSRTRRSLPMALLRAREVVMERFRPMLATHDFSEQQWRVLRVLNETDELDATNLALKANVLMPSLTRIIRMLEGRGLILSRKDPEDRRRALIKLSPAGQAAILEVSPKSMAIYDGIEAEFGHERMTALLDELEGLFNTLSSRK